mmetsp:Transcript_86776/g.269786  ORF Transcript_86776/g.269786 Transcript_86776/m.269786 type:complete len:681 (-) Transcript_86776:33-2075(-)
MFSLMLVRINVLLEGGSLCFILTRFVLPVFGTNAYIAKFKYNRGPEGWSSVAIGFPLTLAAIMGPTLRELTLDQANKRKLLMMAHGMSGAAYAWAAACADYLLILPVVIALPIFAKLGSMPYVSGPGWWLVFVEGLVYPIHLIVFMHTMHSFQQVGQKKAEAFNMILQSTAALLGAAVPATIIWGMILAACTDYPRNAALFPKINMLHLIFSLTLPPYSMPGVVLFVLHQSRAAIFRVYGAVPEGAHVPLDVQDFFKMRAAAPFYLATLPTALMALRLYHRARVAATSQGAGGPPKEVPGPGAPVRDEGVLAEEDRLSQGRLGGDDVLAYRDLRYTYTSESGEHVHAVRGVSLGLRRGECFGLLGPNGAGKTTTLACLTGELWPPTAGSVFFEGQDLSVEGFTALYGKLGMCLQHDDHLWPGLSGVKHLYFYGRVKGVPEDQLEEEVDAALHQVRLRVKDALRPTQQYSGGMKRRLSIAIAVLGRPPMLFMDEPSAAVDVVAKRELWRIIKRRDPGQMVLLTSHQMEEVEALCDRVAIQVLGRLRALGTVTRLRHRYGRGYQLELMTEAKEEELLDGGSSPARQQGQLEDFVRGRVHPQAKLLEAQPGRALFQLEEGEEEGEEVKGRRLCLSALFREVSAARAELRIKDFSLRQPTLEQVFIRFAQEQEEGEVAQRTRRA